MTPRVLTILILLLVGCRQLLDIPSDVSARDGGPGTGADDEDGSAADASGVMDAGPCGSIAAFSAGFDDPSEIEGWTRDAASGCQISVEQGQLFFRQLATPGVCRLFGDIGVNMIHSGLRVQVAEQGNTQMNLVFSLVLHDGNADIRSRRRLRIERDDGQIRLGECTGESCDVDLYGSFPLDPMEHEWWAFRHTSPNERIHFQFGDQDGAFAEPVSPVREIGDDLVRCVGVELASYETTDMGESAFDDLVSGAD